MHVITLFGTPPAQRCIARVGSPWGTTDRGELVPVWSTMSGEGRMVVSGSVMARQLVTVPAPPLSTLTADLAKVLALKWRIKACASTGPNADMRIIDADSSLLVNGPASIELLAPAEWTTRAPTEPDDTTEASVFIRVCPCDCPAPPTAARLTWFDTMVADSEDDARTWLVPRGASRLHVTTTTGVTTIIYNQATTTATQLGRDTLAALPQPIEPLPGAGSVTLNPAPADPGFVSFTWEIAAA